MALLDTKFPQETAELKAGHTSGPRVGDLLSATRAQKGMELQDIANVLRIRLAYLEALENGDHGKLPGHTYALGFVRAYATYLGLDGESVARRFKVEASDFANPSELIFPIPVSESGIPGGAVVFVGLLIAAVVYGGVYFGTSEDAYLRELISPVPEHMAEAVAGKQSADEASMTKVEKETGVSPSSATAAMPHADQNVMPAADAGEISETGVTGSEKPVVATQREEAEPQSALTSGRSQVVSGGEAVPSDVEAAAKIQQAQELVDAASVSVAEATETAAAVETTPAPATESASSVSGTQLAAIPSAPASTPQIGSGTGRVFGAENENSRIEVRAKINSWIQVRDNSTNRLLLTRLLQAGDSYRVPDQTGLQLLTGNAGALEIRVDGKPVPPIGPIGAVRRNVSLDAVSLLEGKAVSE